MVVADAPGERYEVLHRFDNGHGARCWRRSDPHPVFSADGRRIYLNVSSGGSDRRFEVVGRNKL